jgi:hypothetical protein
MSTIKKIEGVCALLALVVLFAGSFAADVYMFSKVSECVGFLNAVFLLL